MLKIHLFGPLQATLDGEPLPSLRADKVRALLAYLAVEADHPHRREQLAGLLWPDYPEVSARTSLRRALADLRKAIADETAQPPFLNVDRQAIQFNRDSDSWVDLSQFASLTRAVGEINQDVIQGWVQAVDLYQGEFMEGFSLPDSSPFEEWQLLTREHYQRQVLDILYQLSETYAAQRDFDSALPYAWRQVELEPTRENAHRQVMRQLALSGQRDAALAQYEACRKVLERELGVEPALETQELYEQLLSGEWPPATSGEVPDSASVAWAIGESPYRGLYPFREEDAPRFFGREAFISQILSAIDKPPGIAAILGSSGSGKSSVAFAGLVPKLRESGGWIIVHFRPGALPFHNLAAALLPSLEDDLSEADRLIESQKLADALMDDRLSLTHLLDRVLEKNPGDRKLLLLLDQFEELYTLCPVPDTRQKFIDELLHVLTQHIESRRSSLVLVFTLRADFMGQALAYRPLADALQNGSLMLGPMTRPEMHAAIEQPAAVQGAAFEGGLVERILDSVGEEPGNLPLLEFALTLLWESGSLTHDKYEQIGQVEGALARYADQVYDALDVEDQLKARSIFVQLVRPGKGTEDTRRVAEKSEIGEQNWQLTQYLADKRLLVTGRSVTGDETVELVHEALIDNWECLKEWIDEDRAFRVWQEGLRDEIQRWQAASRDEGAQLRGIPLSDAEKWVADRRNDLSPLELEFIQESLDSRERRQQERRRVQQRIMLGLGIGLVITLVLAIFAGLQWRRADLERSAAVQAEATAQAQRNQTESALSALLAAQARNLLDQELDLALLLGVESVHRVDTLEGRASLYTALNNSPNLSYFLHGHQNDVHSLAFHPDGGLIASGDKDGVIYLWDLVARKPLGEPLSAHNEQVSSLAFNPDGTLLASAGFDDTLILWDMDRDSPTFAQPIGTPLTAHSGNIWKVAFSPDGSILASAGAGGEIILWDVASSSASFGMEIAKFPGEHKGLVTSLAFSPDGSILASGGSDGELILWDVESRQPLDRVFNDQSAFITCLTFSPDGGTIASGSKDSLVRLWNIDLGTGSFLAVAGEPLTGHQDIVWDLSFTPTGDRLVSGSEDGTLIEWDLDPSSTRYKHAVDLPLIGHQGPVYSLALSPDGTSLVSGGADQKILVWELTFQNALTRDRLVAEDLYVVSDISPDGHDLALAGFEGEIYIYELNSDLWINDDVTPFQLEGHDNVVRTLDFSPDGKKIAAGSDNKTIILWDTDRSSPTYGRMIGSPLIGHHHYVLSVEFSPDSKTLFSGGKDGLIFIWDVESGEQIGSIDPLLELGVNDTELSPDGKTLAVGGFDGAIQLWDVNPDSETFMLMVGAVGERKPRNIHQLEFSPDGKSLVSAEDDGSLRVWDVDPGSASYMQQIGAPLHEQSLPVTTLALTPDGKYLFSGDISGRILLHRGDTREVIEIPYPRESADPNKIVSLSITPDGKTLVTLFRERKILLLDFSFESWQSRACQIANRNLTHQEWQHFFGDEPYQPTCPDLPSE